MWKWVFLETQLSPSSTLVCSHVPGVFSSCPTNFLPSSGFIRWSWKVPPSIQNEPVGQKCAERPYRGVNVDKPHVDKVKCLLWIECVLFFNCPTLPIFYHPFINLCPFSSIHFSILRPFSVRSSLSQPNIFLLLFGLVLRILFFSTSLPSFSSSLTIVSLSPSQIFLTFSSYMPLFIILHIFLPLRRSLHLLHLSFI